MQINNKNNLTNKEVTTKPSHKAIALFFVFTFLQSLLPHHQLWANNNGPNAPEAASFEPVDATDMVNLLTGDMSYVLPLLNIPSPEGGYPLALSYHAGIAMDQEASWVGLGWNLNPGAINRNVNGFADDYYRTKFDEFFFDRGGSKTSYNFSVGYGAVNGSLSVGLGFSWGTNKALGGNVSLGIGPKTGAPGWGGNVSLGTDGASAGIGYDFKGGLSLGLSASSSGSIGASFDNNGTGMSISMNQSNGLGIGFSSSIGKSGSLGLKFNKNGIGINGTYSKSGSKSAVKGAGTGITLNLNNTVSMGDYTVKQSGFNIPIVVPTKFGVFSANFSKQKITWFLNKSEQNIVTGPLNFNKEISNGLCVNCFIPNPTNPASTPILVKSIEAENIEAANTIKNNFEASTNGYCRIQRKIEAFMDVYEFPIDNKLYTSLDKNNIIFPSIDSYNVQAQGISGNLSLKYHENAALFSLSKNNSLFSTAYDIDGRTQPTADNVFTFENKPHFYFENEFNSYMETPEVSFNIDLDNNNNILDYYGSSDANGLPRKKTGNYVEYFTHKDLSNISPAVLHQKGYILPSNQANITKPSDNGIAAFTVISSNGKKYHYSLPVYNHVSVTRTTGTVKNKVEQDAYYEKIQDEPYATHWLLTAITGPDYIDTNGNGKVDEKDYGYWVAFDYGKWSESYAWKIPYGKDYMESEDNPDIKTRIEGFKDVFYLDKIKTRTHTAIFSKSLRSDDMGHNWVYKSIDWNNPRSAFTKRFEIPSQRSLKLEKIILLKNQDAKTLSKNTGDNSSTTPGVISVSFPNPNATEKSYSYNLEDSVFMSNDIPENTLSKAVKVIDLNYANNQNSLVKNTPNHLYSSGGRLTLSSVKFNGKNNTITIPPYQFQYYNGSTFDINNKNDWGYNDNTPWDWSLKSITTPEGGSIEVNYESDDFHKPALQIGRLFASKLQFTFIDIPPQVEGTNPITAPTGIIRMKVEIDPEETNTEELKFADYFDINNSFFMDLWFSGVRNYKGPGYARFTVDIKEKYAKITELNATDNYMIIEVSASSPFLRKEFRMGVNPVSIKHGGSLFPLSNDYYGSSENLSRYDIVWRENGKGNAYSLIYKLIGNKKVYDQKEGDIRVKDLIVSDGINNYKTSYYYSQEGHHQAPNHEQYKSSGTLSYIPNNKNLPIPYASELPAPKVMYEKVKMVNLSSTNSIQGATEYTFNVLKEKDENALKFGDFFEINTREENRIDHAGREISVRKTTVHDNLSAIGQPLEVKNLNSKGQILSISKNKYYKRNNRPNNQGKEQESYQVYKKVHYSNPIFPDKWIIGSSTRVNYASALKSNESYSGGFATFSHYNKYDTITGSTLETTTILSDQTEIKSITVPAYTKYPEMGSKVDTLNNKNMLDQTTASVTEVKKNGNWKTVNANITTWNNNWLYRNIDGSLFKPSNNAEKIWRKHQSFAWKGAVENDGTYSGYVGNFDNFNWESPYNQTNTKWINTSTVNLYDHFSMPLETIDINGNKAATKMGVNQPHIIATANAGYNEMYYSGAEIGTKNPFILSGEVKNGGEDANGNIGVGIGISHVKAHTGTTSLRVSSELNAYEVTMKANEHKTGDYKIAVWVDKGNENNARININGTSKTFNGEQVQAGDWVLLTHYEHFDKATQYTIGIRRTSGNIILYADDFRIHPIEASMTSYVYNEWGELSYIIGANNLATKYEYDAAGRLFKTYNEVIDTPTITGGFKEVSKNTYHYKTQ